eukprot:TRINITY_DN113113_c0_g1_i1.p1 TRINITY_DN113113_c0_g1~~TRINITY_DN113113_c0_g1_i1.p1  ORF type:complete len:422 (+),score=152.67 TRINITY_DN113113_c0_g1_i1:86-1351(+)
MSEGRCWVRVLPTQLLHLVVLVLLLDTPEALTTQRRTHRVQRRRHVEVSEVFVGREAAAPSARPRLALMTKDSHTQAVRQGHFKLAAMAATAGAEPAPAPAPAPGPAAPGGMDPEVVSTVLAQPAKAGDATLEVAAQDKFKVGDSIRIGEEASQQYETKNIIGYGSLILDSPLENSYPANTIVIVIPKADPFAVTPAPQKQLEVLNPMILEANADGSTNLEEEAKSLSKLDEMMDCEKQAMNPDDPASKYKEELAAVDWLEERLQDKNDDMNEEAYQAKIAKAQEALAKETSPGTARMLGDMRREMHRLAAPFFTKVLKRQIKSLERRKKVLLQKIEEIEGAPPAPKEEEEEPKKKAAVVDVDDEDDFTLEAEEEPTEDGSSKSYDLFAAHYKLICYGLVVLALLAGGICGLLSVRQRVHV